MGSTSLAPQITPPSGDVFKVVGVPQQKVFNGVPFPLVVSPVQSSVSLAKAVEDNKPWLESVLQVAGAVLFRGFHVASSSDFNDVVRGFGYEEFTFVGVAAPRTHVFGPIYTSNDSAPHLSVHFHNEMAYLEEHPSKAFFYCEVEPGNQGETPIVLGHIVYERLKTKHSGFLQLLEEHGFVYDKVLPDETDISCPVGLSWKAALSTDDKAIAQQRAAKIGLKLEWIENGAMVTTKPVEGIKIDKTLPDQKRKMWFNSLMVAQASNVPVKIGDGSPIPPQVVEDCKKILEEECAAVPWSQGDVLLLDNWAVQHSRRPFTPPRRVLASFTK